MNTELSVADALALLAPRVPVVGRTKTVAAASALGRVLAQPVASRLDLPAFDNAAMDGYALRAADATGPATRLRLVGRALAGHAWGGTIGTGECVRITTGAPMPQGADAVVMQELARVAGDAVEIDGPIAAGLSCRLRGEHVRLGETVLLAGRRLASYDLGLIAAAGVARIDVHEWLRVGVLSTGNELADPPSPLPSGGAYDGNRPMLLAALAQAGFEAIDLGICPDRGDAFNAIVDRTLNMGLHALLTTGGAAQGDADIVRQAGSVEFVPLNIRPGRGVVFGLLHGDDPRPHPNPPPQAGEGEVPLPCEAGQGWGGGVAPGPKLASSDTPRPVAQVAPQESRRRSPLVLIGLPGNAVAAYVMYRLLARPLLERMGGGEARVPTALPLPLASALRHKGGRTDYRRARIVTRADGTPAVEPLAQQGSAMLLSLSDADVLIAVGPQAAYAAGDPIPTLPLN
ncbi:MAG: molybdopterin molybdotransferase MoeA [Betaproteobacteria bacterium]